MHCMAFQLHVKERRRIFDCTTCNKACLFFEVDVMTEETLVRRIPGYGVVPSWYAILAIAVPGIALLYGVYTMQRSEGVPWSAAVGFIVMAWGMRHLYKLGEDPWIYFWELAAIGPACGAVLTSTAMLLFYVSGWGLVFVPLLLFIEFVATLWALPDEDQFDH